MVSQLKVKEIIKQSGSSISIGESGDTINLAGTAYAEGEKNTPAFRATAAGTTTVANDTATKIAFTTEVFDVGSGYDASNSKFVVPSGEAGKYFFAAAIEYNITSATTSARAQIRKNGSIVIAKQGYNSYYDNNIVCGVVELAVSDYIEVYGYHNSGGSQASQTGSGTNYFVGFKVTA